MDPTVEYIPSRDLLIYKCHHRILNYHVFQIYGQKFAKLLNCVQIPEKTTEVYATNIPRFMRIDQVFKMFVRCGEIFQLRLLMDLGGSNRGQCFVQYIQLRDSRRAVCCLHEEYVDPDGRRLKVNLSLDNNQLLLKNVPGSFSQEKVEQLLRNIIGEGLCSVTLVPTENSTWNSCLCTFRDHQFAVMAHKAKYPVITMEGHLVQVQWAVPQLFIHCVDLYFVGYPANMTKREFFIILSERIDIRTLVHFRFTTKRGYMTFFDMNGLVAAEAALRNLTIRCCTFTFSRTPFRNIAQREYVNHVTNVRMTYLRRLDLRAQLVFPSGTWSYMLRYPRLYANRIFGVPPPPPPPPSPQRPPMRPRRNDSLNPEDD